MPSIFMFMFLPLSSEGMFAQLRDAGVDVYVAGSALYGKPDPVAEVHELKELCLVR